MTNSIINFFKELISFVFSVPKDTEQEQTQKATKGNVKTKKSEESQNNRYIPATAKNIDKYLGGRPVDVGMVFPERLEKALDILEEGGKSTEDTLKAFAILMNLDNDRYLNAKSRFIPGNTFAGYSVRMLYMK